MLKLFVEWRNLSMNINERIEKAIAKGSQLVYYKPKEKGTYYPKDVGCCWNHTKKSHKQKDE